MRTALAIAASLALPGVIAAALATPLNRPVLTQSTSVCGCPDVTDMINRLNMAEAAIELIKADKSRFIDAAINTRVVPFNNTIGPNGKTNYVNFRDSLNDGMAKLAQILGANVSWGETDESCNARVTKHSTPCLDSIVDLHEKEIHKPLCEAQKMAFLVRAPIRMVDYADEEIQGYEREIKEIRTLLRTMPASCRPGWIGFIHYYEKRTVTTTNTLPPTQSRVSGSERSATEFVRTAKILFRENQPSTLNLEIKHDLTLTTQTVVKIGCKGGLMTPQFDRTRSSTVEERGTTEVRGHESSIDARFSYAPATGDWTLGFTLPSTTADGTSIITETQSGNCDAANDGTKATGSKSLPLPVLE